MEKWFKPKRHSGFKKNKTIDGNLRTMYRNTDKGMSKDQRWLRVGRQAQALANVTRDPNTEKKARSVAKAAFSKLK